MTTGLNLQSKKPGANKGIILAMALLVGNVGAFMTSALTVALPKISEEFHPDAVLLNWIITAFVLSWAVFSIPTGRLADIFGLRRLSILGVIIFLVSTTAAVFSNSITLLIILRVIQGIGSAILGGTIVAILTLTFSAKERGMALGFYTSSVYFWLSAGPFLGGLMTEKLDWRSIFIFTIPFGLAILILLIWKVKDEWAGAKGSKFDFTGSLIFGLSLVAVIYGFSKINSLFGILLTSLGIVFAVIFVYWENRVPSPLIDIKTFKHNRPFIFSNLASLITYSATAAIGYLLSLYLQLVKGYSPFHASWILVVQPVIQTLVAFLGGWLSDKIQPRVVASIGMTLLCLGLASLVSLNEHTSTVQIAVILGVLGVGFGLFVPPNTNAIMSSVTPRHYALASSLTSTMRTVGQTLSMGITLILTTLIVGNITITLDYHPGFMTMVKVAFAIFAGLCLVGIFASLARGKNAPAGEEVSPPSGR